MERQDSGKTFATQELFVVIQGAVVVLKDEEFLLKMPYMLPLPLVEGQRKAAHHREGLHEQIRVVLFPKEQILEIGVLERVASFGEKVEIPSPLHFHGFQSRGDDFLVPEEKLEVR